MPIELHRDGGDERRWTLHADNGRKIAASGEGYRGKRHGEDAVALVKRASDAPVRTRPA